MYIHKHVPLRVNKQKPFVEGISTVCGTFLLQQSKQSRLAKSETVSTNPVKVLDRTVPP